MHKIHLINKELPKPKFKPYIHQIQLIKPKITKTENQTLYKSN